MIYERKNGDFFQFPNSILMETPQPIILTKREEKWNFILHQGRHSFKRITVVKEKTCLKNILFWLNIT